MRNTFLLLLLNAFQIFAGNSYSQSASLSLSYKDATIKDVLSGIEDKTEFFFLYNSKLVDVNEKVSLNVKDQKIDKVLASIFEGTNVKYMVFNRQIVLTPGDYLESLESKSQPLTIQGTVKDSDGNPVIGATVSEKATGKGTITDYEGKFSLNVTSADALLSISFVGMKTVQVMLDGRTNVDIILEQGVIGLDEVVVTALGIEKEKKILSYAAQDISGDILEKSNEANLVNSLQGAVAGVQITNTSGAVSSSSRIVLRGSSSLTGNNQPLFVVDGVPLYNSNSSNFRYGGVDYGNEIADIDQNNIASITVLKGPNAAALYGSRAANGVIMITTKTGKKSGKGFGMDFTSSITIQNPKYIPAFQNKYGKGKEKQYSYVDGIGGGLWDDGSNWGPPLDKGLLIDQWTGKQQPWISHPDNVREVYQNGLVYNNNISFYKNTEGMTSRFSYSDIRQKGIVPFTDETKNSLSFNTSMKINDRLEAELSGNYNILKNDNIPVGGYTGANPFGFLIWDAGRDWDIAKMRDYENPDGTQKNQYSIYNDNPFFIYKNNTNSRLRNRLYGNANATYKITDWLKFMVRLGLDNYNETRESVTNANSVDIKQWGGGHGGKFSKTEIYRQEVNTDFILSAQKEFDSKFSISANLGANLLDNTYRSMSVSAAKLVVPNLYNISNVLGEAGRSNYESHYKTQSVFGEVVFGYGNYLFLSATGRNDWSSTLPQENWSYFYPSIGGSLILTEALGLESDVISYAKIRSSWAQVGNFASPYQLQNVFSARDPWNNQPIFTSSSTLPPQNLKPEITSSLELGADLSFFMNRISAGITWYSSSSVNQILNVSIARSSGYFSEVVNAGEITNKGIEFTFTAIPVKTKDFRWDASFNWAKNESQIVELYRDLTSYTIGGIWGVNSYAKPGGAYGDIWGIGFARNEKGEILVKADGTPIKNGKQIKLGSILPDWIAGFRNTLSYRNLSLSVLIDMRKGSDVYSLGQRYGSMTGSLKETADNNIREDGVILGKNMMKDEKFVYENGETNTSVVDAMKMYSSAGILDIQEYSTFDASYLKLRELSLTYSLPSSIMSKLNFIDRASLSFIGRNLAILYSNMPEGYDPEMSAGGTDSGQGFEYGYYPTTANYSFKLQLTF